MINDLPNGCDQQLYYNGWMLSDICPATCSICCDDEEACNANGDGSCDYAEENYDCDGNCTAGEDCLGDCGGSAEVDECGVCNGPGETEECGCEGIPDGACDCDGNVLDECGECGGSGIPDGECDCAGNVADCSGECGGSAEVDDCGECGGGGPEECWDGSSTCDLSDCPDASSVTYNVYRDGEFLIGGLENASHVDGNLGYLATHCYSVTYTSDGVESDHSDEACATTNEAPYVFGCTDADACNYDADANMDNGTCEYAQENYDCDGNCTAGEDCLGDCGGSAEVDECGVCEGDNSSCKQVILSATTMGDTIFVNYNSNFAIGGFQFTIQGAMLASAFGGVADNSGFNLSTSYYKVIGFSLSNLKRDSKSDI